ncbi:MAG: recombination protein RecR [Candidatus Omnitrophica bacterium]|nr:recombination protein RecR [Candidatus Omnitrophota bacterium]
MEDLINELVKMPGIGPRTAERLAFYILKISKEQARALSDSILALKDKVVLCKNCFNLSEDETCRICKDPTRDASILCVVEESKDIIAIEKTQGYKGLYHVLLGVLSPLDGIGPDDLKIKELIPRIKSSIIKELIIATSSSTEGEATALYLTKLIKPLGVKLTRIAYGIPVGTNLDYTDQATLARALEGRTEL